MSLRTLPVSLALVVSCPSTHAIPILGYGELSVLITSLVMFLFRGIYLVCDYMIIDDFIYNIQREW